MKFALPDFFHYLFGFLLLLCFLFGFYKLSFIIILIFVLLLFFTRLTSPLYQEELAYKEGIFFSPINGDVVSIEGNNITVIIPWWRSFGIYLPVKSEVKNVIYNEGLSLLRYFKGRLSQDRIDDYQYAEVSFLSDLGEFSLYFIKCPLGLLPYFQVMPGDRGKALVLTGHFLLGGTVVINLPEKMKIQVSKGMKLSAGETILASQS